MSASIFGGKPAHRAVVFEMVGTYGLSAGHGTTPSPTIHRRQLLRSQCPAIIVLPPHKSGFMPDCAIENIDSQVDKLPMIIFENVVGRASRGSCDQSSAAVATGQPKQPGIGRNLSG